MRINFRVVHGQNNFWPAVGFTMKLTNHPALTICALCTIVVGSWFLWRQLMPPSPAHHQQLLTGIGAGLAGEVVQQVHDRGEIVIVVDKAQVHGGVPANVPLTELQQQLRRLQGISVRATEIIPQVVVEDRMTPSCSAAEFIEIIRRHPAADAVVFLVPLPEWTRVSTAMEQVSRPKLIAFDPATQQVRGRYAGYFERGLLVSLVIPRRVPPTKKGGVPQSPREFFERDFEVVAPQNFQSLSE